MPGLPRVHDPRDPSKCELTNCMNVSDPPSKKCAIHGSNLDNSRAAKADLRNYRLNKWQSRVNEFADNDKVKSLREEIGVLRILLEETMGRCSEPNELLIASGRIADLVMKIEKVVSSCHRLEASTGMLLDRTAVLQLASTIVEIIGRHVRDADITEKIATEIIVCVTSNPMEPVTPIQEPVTPAQEPIQLELE